MVFVEEEERKSQLRAEIAKTYSRYLLSYGFVGFLKSRYRDSVAYKTIKKAEKYSKVDMQVNNSWHLRAGLSLSRSGFWGEYGNESFSLWAINKFSRSAPKIGLSYHWSSYIAKTSYNLDAAGEDPIFLTELAYRF